MRASQSPVQSEEIRGVRDAETFLESIKNLNSSDAYKAIFERVLELNGGEDPKIRGEVARLESELDQFDQSCEDYEEYVMQQERRSDPEWNGGEEDVANWKGPKGTWT